MAFHFDARADSSDEEGGGGIDLSAWKTGAGPGASRPTSQRAPAPIARMVAPQDRESSRGSGTPDLAAFQSSTRKSKSVSRTRSPPRPSFQAVNRQVQEPDEESTYDLDTPDPILEGGFQDEEQDEEEAGPTQPRKLFVGIDRDEEDVDDFEDLTKGSENVRQVLSAVPQKGGKVLYTVLFDDFHKEKVSPQHLWIYVEQHMRIFWITLRPSMSGVYGFSNGCAMSWPSFFGGSKCLSSPQRLSRLDGLLRHFRRGELHIRPHMKIARARSENFCRLTSDLPL